MEPWVVIGALGYLAYVVVFVANHPGGTVTGIRALTLFPVVVPVMLFWWVVGRAKFTRNRGQRGFSIGIEKK